MKDDKLITATDFAKEITDLMTSGHTRLEAIIEYQERHNLDEYAITHLLAKNKSLMVDLTTECKNANLLK